MKEIKTDEPFEVMLWFDIKMFCSRIENLLLEIKRINQKEYITHLLNVRNELKNIVRELENE